MKTFLRRASRKRCSFVKIKQITVLALACMSLLLGGCAGFDELAQAMGFPTKDAGDTAELPKTIEEDASPVIVIETPEEETVVTEPEEEVVEEFFWDDDNKLYTMEAADKDRVTISFIGDINFCEDYANMRVLRDQEGGRLSGCILPDVMETMRSADIMMANNEFAYSDRGSPTDGKKYTFRAKPEHVEKLHEMGVDIVALANNHAYDWGPDALMDTFDLLREHKIPYVGAGRNLAEAMHPVYVKVNGRTIAFVAATQIERTPNPDTKEATETEPGVLRTLDPTKFLTVIDEAEHNADFTIVYVHWGSENTDLVEESQRELAQKYVNAGADLIIGDHSHCLQGIDYVGGVPIFYSLGNFWFNSKRVDTCIVSVTIDTTRAEADPESETEGPAFADALPIESIRFIPCVQQSCHTRLADEADAERILNYLQGISNHALVGSDGLITYSEEDHNTQGGVNTSPSRSKEPTADSADLDPSMLVLDAPPEAPTEAPAGE
ncbi:MAG: CapA family protein [Lachnospiraceae bacterium]|nr:CapA family protein [Lachnospiraceae bacterium]